MDNISKKITCWLIKREAVLQEEKEIYEYAIFSLIITLFPILVVNIVSLFMNAFVESFFIIIPFIFIRKYCGGYHAKHLCVCMISSCGSLVLCVYLAIHIEYNILMNYILVLGAICLFVFSPIDSENRKLTNEDKKTYKHMTIKMVLLFAFLYFVFLSICKEYSICIFWGIILSAFFQVPCFILKLVDVFRNIRLLKRGK